MEIREQIKLYNAAISNTINLYRLWAKRNDMNYNALIVLYTIDEYGICTQKQICETWALPKQTVHGILREFEKRGYIQIKANASNKREKFVSYTDIGRSYAATILNDLHKKEECAMQALGTEVCDQLIDSNAAYYQAFMKELEHE